jgi:protoporphyrin/coproporphyrin ferrochelatase
MEKKAVILMAYGSPERAEEVEPYYTHIRGGRKPTLKEVENLKQRYEQTGGRSHLREMKHWHPFIAEVFEEISNDGVTDLLTVALAPHYSKMSIGSYQDAVKKANEEHGSKVKIVNVDDWYLNPVFLDKWTRRIVDAVEKKFRKGKQEAFFLFSAHSLPERILTWGDPYKDQLLETQEKLAKKLSLDRKQYGFAFQSAAHTSEPWLGPDILDKIRDLHEEWSEILIVPVGFVSDHLEIFYDIDIEAQDLANELGIQVERTESFNDSDDFIEVLESVVKDQGFLGS